MIIAMLAEQLTAPFSGASQAIPSRRQTVPPQARPETRGALERELRAALPLIAGRPRILALACDACLDWLPVLPDLEGFKGEITLQDADAGALMLAERTIGPVVGPCRLLHGNVVQMVKRLEYDDPFDLVLAGDLLTVLPDSTALGLLRSIYSRLLGAGGVLIFSCAAPDGGACLELAEPFGVERSEAQLHELCQLAGIPGPAIRIERGRSEPKLSVRIAKV